MALLGTAGSADGKPKTASAELYRLVVRAQMAARSADSKLFTNMEAVSSAVEKYHKEHGRLPQSEPENEELEKSLAALATKNPYLDDEMLAQQLAIEERHPNQTITYRITTDLGLSQSWATQLVKTPPESWTAPPGTVSIVHNTSDFVLIWSSGADGRPIKEDSTGTARTILRQLESPAPEAK